MILALFLNLLVDFVKTDIPVKDVEQLAVSRDEKLDHNHANEEVFLTARNILYGSRVTNKVVVENLQKNRDIRLTTLSFQGRS